MTTGTPKTGQDSSAPPGGWVFGDDEHKVANKACEDEFIEWEKTKTYDWVNLAVRLNAIAIRTVRKHRKWGSKPEGAV